MNVFLLSKPEKGTRNTLNNLTKSSQPPHDPTADPGSTFSAPFSSSLRKGRRAWWRLQDTGLFVSVKGQRCRTAGREGRQPRIALSLCVTLSIFRKVLCTWVVRDLDLTQPSYSSLCMIGKGRGSRTCRTRSDVSEVGLGAKTTQGVRSGYSVGSGGRRESEPGAW